MSRRNMRNGLMNPEKNYYAPVETTMRQTTCLNRIFQRVDAEGFSSEVIAELESDIDFIAKKYNIDARSVAMLAAILEMSNTNHCMDEEDLARYLGCTNIEFMQCRGCLAEMERRGIICASSGMRTYYRVTSEAYKAIEKESEFIPVKMSDLTANELFSRFRKFYQQYRKNQLQNDELINKLDSLISANSHLLFCQKIVESGLYEPIEDIWRKLFLYMCHRYVSHGEASVDIDRLLDFTEYLDDDRAIVFKLRKGTSYLQQRKLVEFANDNGMSDTGSLSLSDKVKAEFFQGIEMMPEAQTTRSDMVKAAKITPKELFYNEAEAIQINRLEGLLQPENFAGIQKRLSETGMRKGFNVLFYGGPGTGKTASVYELARRSGRDIFAVDMSKLKSKWVGESEKSIKAVFKIYRDMCRTSDRTPILLFNEADAIFMRRIENVEHSTDQMNNAMQNIILQEMENLEGILIATTNLVGNLDSAFERRFLFKVEFNKPEAGARAKIWKSMIDSLSDEDAATLASQFEFSGGNIENVARKSSVEYILTGQQPTVDTLATFCKEENYAQSGRRKIGY